MCVKISCRARRQIQIKNPSGLTDKCVSNKFFRASNRVYMYTIIQGLQTYIHQKIIQGLQTNIYQKIIQGLHTSVCQKKSFKAYRHIYIYIYYKSFNAYRQVYVKEIHVQIKFRGHKKYISKMHQGSQTNVCGKFCRVQRQKSCGKIL